jgi:hypothetical protein
MNNRTKFTLAIVLGFSFSGIQALCLDQHRVASAQANATNCPSFAGKWLVRVKNSNRTVLQRITREYPSIQVRSCYWRDTNNRVDGIQLGPFPTPQSAGLFYQKLTASRVRSTDVTIVDPPRQFPTVRPRNR